MQKHTAGAAFCYIKSRKYQVSLLAYNLQKEILSGSSQRSDLLAIVWSHASLLFIRRKAKTKNERGTENELFYDRRTKPDQAKCT